jgi:phospholipid transport system substrate-binding protein
MTPIFLAAALLAADAPSDKDIQKVVKTVITAVQYGKDDLAAKQVAFSPMAQNLMAPEWATIPDAEKKEIATGLETIVRKISFPKGRDLFAHLDAVLYDKVKMDGDKARVKTTVVVNRAYKKQEVVIDFILQKEGGAWKILDTIMLGQSTLEGIRVDQIEPLLAEGGVPNVLKALRAKVAELK